MEESPVQFHTEEIEFELSNDTLYRHWVDIIVRKHNRKTGFINYIFCSDDYLLDMNKSYLDHDTLTDIITFPHRSDDILESDIFISIDRVKDNAEGLETDFETELKRVMAHGILHLCGFGDKTETEAAVMRKMEDEAIALFPSAKDLDS